MALPQIISRNQKQIIGEIIRGSDLTVLGSGGFTEAAVYEGICSTYVCPVGKKAKVRGTFTTVALGTNTVLICRIADLSRGTNVEVARAIANQSIQFEATLSNDDRIQFSGDNAADDGTAECIAVITELPE